MFWYKSQYKTLPYSNIHFRELSYQKVTNSRQIKSTKEIFDDLQTSLEKHSESKVLLDHLNQDQIDGLLFQAADFDNREVILYILKETVREPSRYCLGKILRQYIKDKEILVVCQESLKLNWMQPYFVANIWHKGDLKQAAQKFKELYYISDERQKQIILFLLREITKETVGFKSEATLIILSSLAEYFVCIFDDYSVLTYLWLEAFKSSWYSDHCLAEELYNKHPGLRKSLSKTEVVSNYVRSLLLIDDIDTCQRLIQIYLKFREKESSRLCLCLLFDYYYLNRNLMACSEIIKFCKNCNITLTDHEDRLLNLLLGVNSNERKVKRIKKVPKYKFKF